VKLFVLILMAVCRSIDTTAGGMNKPSLPEYRDEEEICTKDYSIFLMK
jgi:hypothetical protein